MSDSITVTKMVDMGQRLGDGALSGEIFSAVMITQSLDGTLEVQATSQSSFEVLGILNIASILMTRKGFGPQF